MAVPDPCCGRVRLQTATKILAIVEIIFSILELMVGIIMLISITSSKAKIENNENQRYQGSYAAYVGSATILIIVSIFDLIVSIILLLGANQRDLKKCRIWFVVAVGLMVLSFVSLIVNVSGTYLAGASTLESIVSLALRSYMSWVVLAFMAELKGVNVPT